MLALLKVCIQVILDIVLSPTYWVAVLLVIFQFFRMGKLERSILGANKSTLHKRILRTVFLGMLGGSIGSMIIVGLGITIHHQDFIYLMITALFLLLIQQRFICFAYGGGIIGLLHLTLGYPKVDVPSMMAMIAVVHLVEGILVYIDGDTFKIPIFIEVDNRTVGGFSMMSFWPMPFMIMLSTTHWLPSGMTPLWEGWPLFNQSSMVQSMPMLSYLLGGFVAILGYSDIAISSHPKIRVRKTAKLLFVYSGLLLIASILALKLIAFQYIAVIFAPVGHEAIIRIGRTTELKGKSRYRASKEGVKVLDVVPGGVGAKLGLKTGDILYALNGLRVNEKKDIKRILNGRPKVIQLDYFDDLKKVMVSRDIKASRKGINALNILIVPEDSLYVFDIFKNQGILALLIGKKMNRKA